MLIMPYHYVSKLLPFLRRFMSRNVSVERASRCLFFLLRYARRGLFFRVMQTVNCNLTHPLVALCRIHHNQILADRSLVGTLDTMRKVASTSVQTEYVD